MHIGLLPSEVADIVHPFCSGEDDICYHSILLLVTKGDLVEEFSSGGSSALHTTLYLVCQLATEMRIA